MDFLNILVGGHDMKGLMPDRRRVLQYLHSTHLWEAPYLAVVHTVFILFISCCESSFQVTSGYYCTNGPLSSSNERLVEKFYQYVVKLD